MVVSTAFGELAEILECLEHTDADVQDITLKEEALDNAETITADIRVGIPVFVDLDICEDVSIEADGTDLTEEKLDFELSVSVPTDGCSNDSPITSALIGNESLPSSPSSLSTSGSGVPAYKDPEALQAVYEEYDTFPEMTEALGVDVTSETVRRYMVKHDIHDPANDDDIERKDTETSDDQVGDTDNSEMEGTETEIPEPDPDDVPLADALAAADKDETEESHAADGLGVRTDLTIADFVNILEESQTVYEVAQRLETEHEHTRRLLDDFNLLNLVTSRLSSSQDELAPTEVCRRIGYTDFSDSSM